MRQLIIISILVFLLSTSILAQARKGIASWYGHPYHGRITANGEIYNMETMTCAIVSTLKHKFLNNMLRVTCLDNNQSILVWANDVLPAYHGRLVDLSHEAMRRLGMITTKHGTIVSCEDNGLVHVKIEVVNPTYIPRSEAMK